MAEIKIEKKKPIWPWILVVLIILAAIYFFWFYNDQDYDNNDDLLNNDTITEIDDRDVYDNSDEDSTTLYTGTYGTVVKEKAVSNYFTYIDNNQMGLDHEYTNGALVHLITAVEAEAKNLNVDIDANIEKARENAFEITKDPMSLKHADKIRAAALEITTALKTIQQQKFSSLSSEVDGLKTAAEDINPQAPTLEQKEDAKNFFEKAGRLLQKMNEYENNQ
ncbi:hypothetical protein [Aequorivita lipolytica]|uniref:Uncharacterized protein n=1 Tax=Aequorivita lipolytica TaxID=153267 RepID=A0A5C6YND0_9FLAO|nr:hypothetical protein [Aequorivita lipolytica]TXD68559.1 hypothetical protein ESV24_11645 [Aequorivita lipolytica]SRX53291.1 hypothetical protein AEQU2_02521 [Aequorivita lipolytica]